MACDCFQGILYLYPLHRYNTGKGITDIALCDLFESLVLNLVHFELCNPRYAKPELWARLSDSVPCPSGVTPPANITEELTLSSPNPRDTRFTIIVLADPNSTVSNVGITEPCPQPSCRPGGAFCCIILHSPGKSNASPLITVETYSLYPLTKDFKMAENDTNHTSPIFG
jgi:hypothetical protein